ncbi:MAG: hypothetical protein Ct9H300mP25_10480 [Acidobacteriota bacterium]|nr:MAG: hypothetical protein Ct9H300mP25_10480 [Acidobacteriota bacterium]
MMIRRKVELVSQSLRKCVFVSHGKAADNPPGPGNCQTMRYLCRPIGQSTYDAQQRRLYLGHSLLQKNQRPCPNVLSSVVMPLDKVDYFGGRGQWFRQLTPLKN